MRPGSEPFLAKNDVLQTEQMAFAKDLGLFRTKSMIVAGTCLTLMALAISCLPLNHLSGFSQQRHISRTFQVLFGVSRQGLWRLCRFDALSVQIKAFQWSRGLAAQAQLSVGEKISAIADKARKQEEAITQEPPSLACRVRAMCPPLSFAARYIIVIAFAQTAAGDNYSPSRCA